MKFLNSYTLVDGFIGSLSEMVRLIPEISDIGTWLPLFLSLIPQLLIGTEAEAMASVFLIGRLEEALEKGLRIISLFAFIVATIVVMYGGYQIRTGNADAGKMSILGGLVIGLAVIIVTSIFEIADLPVLKVTK